MKKVVIVLLLLAVAAGGWFWWRSAHREKPLKILKTEEVRRGTARKVLEETGIIKSQVGAIVKIGARSTGTVDRMLVKVGDRVEKGQQVARIDSRELRAQQDEAAAALASAQAELARIERVSPLQIAEAAANLAEAQAQSAYLTDNAGRFENLLAAGFVSRDEADNARQKAVAQQRQVAARQASLERLQGEFAGNRVKAAQAVKQAAANLESLAIRISYTAIHSPIDGVVSQVTAQEGETIVAGLQVANLVTVLDTTRLEMWVYVDETDVGQVKPGQLVEFRVDAYPGRIFKGSIATIYPVPEIRDNIVYYQALVTVDPDQATLLRPEMTTQVQIVVAQKDDVLLIPNTALKWVDDSQFIFVREADGSVTRVTPKLGLTGLTHSEVTEGLEEGAAVATEVSLPGSTPARNRP
jgi:HlyD family secretion protein/macrolide-specific efflux system membrane fusion protein